MRPGIYREMLSADPASHGVGEKNEHVKGRELTDGEKKKCCAEIKLIQEVLYGKIDVKDSEYTGLKETVDTFFKDVKEGMDVEEFYRTEKVNLDKIKNYLQAIDFFFKTVEDSYMYGHYDHDLGGMTRRFIEFLQRVTEDYDFPKDWPELTKHLLDLKDAWQFFLLRIWDTLLRGVSRERVPPEHRGEVDLGLIANGFSHFETWYRGQYPGEFKVLNTGEVRACKLDLLQFNEEWPKIIERLNRDNKYVQGNTALVANLAMNALGNSMKNRIDSNNVKVTLQVKESAGAELLSIIVEDDGRGMEDEHLDPNNTEHFILSYGRSDTNSTGLGLADAHTRLESTKGILRIASKRRPEQEDQPTKVVQYSNVPLAEKLDFPEDKVCGTKIEICLPILKRK